MKIDAEAKLYLYGSRVFDDKKGGDIDLAVLSDKIAMKDEFTILENYYQEFDEEKIDLLTVKPPFDTPFWKYISKHAVQL